MNMEQGEPTMHPKFPTNRRVAMNAAAQLEQARADVRALEWRRRQAGESAGDARRAVAREIKVPLGTLENLARGRLKRLDAWLRDGINRVVVRELERELARLTHEYETRRRAGAHLNSQHLGEVETHMAAVRQAISDIQ